MFSQNSFLVAALITGLIAAAFLMFASLDGALQQIQAF